MIKLVFFLVTFSLATVISEACEQFRESDRCDMAEKWPRQVCNDSKSFYDCVDGKVAKFLCPIVNKQQKLFHPETNQCLKPGGYVKKTRTKRAGGSAKVNDLCVYNTDCLDGSFCNAGLCACMSNYVLRSPYCYPKVDPGQNGCSYVEQCSAVWFGATCVSSVCTCPNSGTLTGAAVATKDGYVCILTAASAKQNACPLPAGYGWKTAVTASTGTTAALFTCIPTAANTCQDPELYDCINNGNRAENLGICCPNRSFTCTQKMDTGGSGGTTLRYWYNMATGTCQPFSWNPSSTATSTSGSANNFESQDMCLSFCQNRCPRGQPQYTTTSSLWSSNRPVSCATGSCNTNNYQCTQIGSSQLCCSKPSFICSNYGVSNAGGIGTFVSRTPACGSTGADCGFAALYPSAQDVATAGTAMTITSASETRYYYNANTKSCATFTYLGAGGNYNNFLSLADCNTYCGNQLLCTQGSPLKDTNGQNRVCSGSGCPSQYSCTNNVCCPTAQNVCTQPKQVGTCTAYVTAFWFNSVSKQCEPFQYSGCFGNDNNFASQLTCQNYCRSTTAGPQCPQGSAYMSGSTYLSCSTTGFSTTTCPANYECYYDGTNYACCPTQAYTCSITYNTGSVCGPPVTRWYFDPTSQSCQTFQFNGCDGNPNNFATQSLCQTYCGSGSCPSGGVPYQESNGQTRICSAAVTCPSAFECTSVSLSTSSVVSYCCPSRAYVCSLPPLSGANCNSNTFIQRYYFNAPNKQCITFNYNGCSGNGNNFATLAACQNFCNAAGCQSGEAVYTDPYSQTVFQCNPSISTSCPSGYTCRYDSLNQRNVCCGGPTGGVCPAGERVYTDVSTQQGRTCYPNVINSCPTSYLCRLNSNLNKFYCCAPPTTGVCTSGYVPSFVPGTSQPQPCFNQVVNPCPTGFTCQVSGQTYQGYCCSTTPACMGGNSLYMKSDGTPQICTLNGFGTACPASYSCQSSQVGSTTGYCCSGAAAVCPTNFSPYPSATQPQSCAPTLNNCQSPATCQLSPMMANQYYCCVPSTTNSQICPMNFTPYQPNNQLLVCFAGSNNCLGGSSCQVSPMNPGISYCCLPATTSPSTTNVCPTGTNTQNPLTTCVPGSFSTCLQGYLCQQSPLATSLFVCCSTVASSSVYCPPGTDSVPPSAQLQPGMMPTTCQIGSSTCPSGYSCQYTAAINNYICCGTAQTVVTSTCPPGLSPYVQNGQTQTCTPGGACPGIGYSCQFSTTTGQYICCGNPQQTVTTGICPGGATPFTSTFTNTPQLCNPPPTPVAASGCPATGYACVMGTTNQYICCPGNTVTQPSTMQLTQQCPVGMSAALYPNTQLPLVCPGTSSTSCPAGTTCQASLTNSFYCCSQGGTVLQQTIRDGCPAGVGYVSPGTSTVQTCQPTNAFNPTVFGGCPTGYSCVFSNTNFRYQCCSRTFVRTSNQTVSI